MIHRTQQSTLLLPIYCKRYNSGTVKWKRCIREYGCPCGSTIPWHINMLTNPETLQVWFRSFYFYRVVVAPLQAWLIVPLYVCAQLLSHVRLFEPSRLLCPWNFPGKNTGMGCHFFLQEIFPNKGLNPYLFCFLHWQADYLPLCHLKYVQHILCLIFSPQTSTLHN